MKIAKGKIIHDKKTQNQEEIKKIEKNNII